MSSSSSDDSYNATLSTLSPHELSRLTTEPRMVESILDAFPPTSTATVTLRYYSSMSRSIDILEHELDRITNERSQIYNHLLSNRRFRRRITPIVNEYRLLTGHNNRRRYHPYGHTPPPIRTPSWPGSNHPPSSIEITPAEALARIMTPPNASSDDERQARYPSRPSTHSKPNSLASFKTTIDDTPGTRFNPIVVHDDEDERCPQCNRPGHSGDKCEISIRSFATYGTLRILL